MGCYLVDNSVCFRYWNRGLFSVFSTEPAMYIVDDITFAELSEDIGENDGQSGYVGEAGTKLLNTTSLDDFSLNMVSSWSIVDEGETVFVKYYYIVSGVSVLNVDSALNEFYCKFEMTNKILNEETNEYEIDSTEIIEAWLNVSDNGTRMYYFKKTVSGVDNVLNSFYYQVVPEVDVENPENIDGDTIDEVFLKMQLIEEEASAFSDLANGEMRYMLMYYLTGINPLTTLNLDGESYGTFSAERIETETKYEYNIMESYLDTRDDEDENFNIEANIEISKNTGSLIFYDVLLEGLDYTRNYILSTGTFVLEEWITPTEEFSPIPEN